MAAGYAEQTVGTSSVRPNTASTTLTDLPNEILEQIVNQVHQENTSDDVILPRTCRQLAARVLPIIYKIDAEEKESPKGSLFSHRSVPMALQWACWFGVLNTARSSLHAATDVGINMPSMLNYVFDGTELSIMREERAEREGQPGYLAALDPLGMQQHTLLQLACARGNTTVAQLLVDHGARVDVEDQNRISPLGYCPNSHVARFLVERGAHLNAEDQGCGRSSLGFLIHWSGGFYLSGDWRWAEPPREDGEGALHPSHHILDPVGAIKVLVEIFGTGAYAQHDTLKGHHPLRRAVQHRWAEVVKLLLDAGFSPDPTPIPGKRPEGSMLGMAMAWHAGYDIVHMLLDAGAGVEPIGTPFNNPIDHLSPEGGRRRPACIPEENVKVAHRVCSRIKDINAPLWGKNGWALRKYVYMRHLDIAEVLVEHGADMGQANVERKDGVLVEAGPVEHVPDPNGWDEQYFRDHRWQYVPVEQHLDWVRPEDEDDYL